MVAVPTLPSRTITVSRVGSLFGAVAVSSLHKAKKTVLLSCAFPLWINQLWINLHCVKSFFLQIECEPEILCPIDLLPNTTFLPLDLAYSFPSLLSRCFFFLQLHTAAAHVASDHIAISPVSPIHHFYIFLPFFVHRIDEFCTPTLILQPLDTKRTFYRTLYPLLSSALCTLT